MPVRWCLDCGRTFQPNGKLRSRCGICQGRQKAWRNADRKTAKAVVAQSPVCAKCGSTKDLTADHVIPGGAHTGPRQTLCRTCNSRKRDRV